MAPSMLRGSMGSDPTPKGMEVTSMKKLNLKKLEKRIAPRYMPF